MLACVSTLQDVNSYQDVRHSKEWLTSHEAINYIFQNCPAIWAIMKDYISPRYSIIYAWAKAKPNRWHSPTLKMIKVKDDGCRSVNFWCAKTIDEEEKRFAKELRTPPACWHEKNFMHKARVRFLGEEETKKIEDIYDNRYDNREELNKLAMELHGEPVWGTFYDPEWFS